jgi:hypothetical protein
VFLKITLSIFSSEDFIIIYNGEKCKPKPIEVNNLKKNFLKIIFIENSYMQFFYIKNASKDQILKNTTINKNFEGHCCSFSAGWEIVEEKKKIEN